MGAGSSVQETETLRQQVQRQNDELLESQARRHEQDSLQQRQQRELDEKTTSLAAATARVAELEERVQSLSLQAEQASKQKAEEAEQQAVRIKQLEADKQLLEDKLKASESEDKASLQTRLRHYVGLTQEQAARITELETTIKAMKQAALLAAAPKPEAPIHDYVLEYEESVSEFSRKEQTAARDA